MPCCELRPLQQSTPALSSAAGGGDGEGGGGEGDGGGGEGEGGGGEGGGGEGEGGGGEGEGGGGEGGGGEGDGGGAGCGYGVGHDLQTSHPPGLQLFMLLVVPHSPSPSQKAPTLSEACWQWGVAELMLEGHSLAATGRRQRGDCPFIGHGIWPARQENGT